MTIKRRRIVPTPAERRTGWALIIGLFMAMVFTLATEGDPSLRHLPRRHMADAHLCLVYYETDGAVGTRYVQC